MVTPEVAQPADLSHIETDNGFEEKETNKSAMQKVLSVPGELHDSNPLRLGVPKAAENVANQVQSLVMNLGGDKPVYSVLVANNGNAAVKFIRSVRSWAYKTFG
eukprot:CAMPEP_0177623330 /NCGR_PEP_ID=MMETSP0419_2-20121207/28846_1 /TAXON_ID=582737 /ORGANISM="Tetraselmis sp., Strain GSL018" /LENGTH=103 /DNA_ID=CAMNT_0019123877 /DNA_START=262 /DNA_END=570 /DNA_ORIENTATION=+